MNPSRTNSTTADAAMSTSSSLSPSTPVRPSRPVPHTPPPAPRKAAAAAVVVDVDVESPDSPMPLAAAADTIASPAVPKATKNKLDRTEEDANTSPKKRAKHDHDSEDDEKKEEEEEEEEDDDDDAVTDVPWEEGMCDVHNCRQTATVFCRHSQGFCETHKCEYTRKCRAIGCKKAFVLCDICDTEAVCPRCEMLTCVEHTPKNPGDCQRCASNWAEPDMELNEATDSYTCFRCHSKEADAKCACPLSHLCKDCMALVADRPEVPKDARDNCAMKGCQLLLLSTCGVCAHAFKCDTCAKLFCARHIGCCDGYQRTAESPEVGCQKMVCSTCSKRKDVQEFCCPRGCISVLGGASSSSSSSSSSASAPVLEEEKKKCRRCHLPVVDLACGVCHSDFCAPCHVITRTLPLGYGLNAADDCTACHKSVGPACVYCSKAHICTTCRATGFFFPPYCKEHIGPCQSCGEQTCVKHNANKDKTKTTCEACATATASA